MQDMDGLRNFVPPDSWNARRWLNDVRRKSKMGPFEATGKLVLTAIASGTASITVTRDGVKEQTETLSAGQTFNRFALKKMRIEVDNTPVVAMKTNGGEVLRCHAKQVTIDLEWRAHPKDAGRKKVFCTIR